MARQGFLSTFTHAELCAVAVKWLQRPHSGGGPGCMVAVSEVASGWTGEIPDAIGFSLAHWESGATVIEVKVSRSDFLADKHKPHRQAGGIGSWRYYMAPKGLIKVAELPQDWGLIEVTPGGICQVQAGAMSQVRKLGYDALKGQVERWRHIDVDRDREQWVLVKLLARLGDTEKLNQQRREEYRERSRLHGRIEELSKEMAQLRRDIRYQTRQDRMAVGSEAAIARIPGAKSSPLHGMGN
jgi:hypothetical protein